jgi:molecular chaperone GrpE
MAENKKIDEIALTEDESGVFHVEDEEESSVGKVVILQEEQDKVETPSAQETNKWEEKYLYLRADFENYKKRVQKDQIDQSKFANEKLLREVLGVLDNLERAILHFNESHDFEKVLEGLGLVSKQFLTFLNRFGVSPVESLNKPFDPDCHQAVGHIDRPDIPEGEVAEEVQKGYRLYDRLIRPSFVMISKRGTASAGTGATDTIDITMPEDGTTPPLGGTIDVGV